MPVWSRDLDLSIVSVSVWSQHIANGGGAPMG